MTEPKTKELSRRDALKILGAVAGASVLANLPSKWSKPQLATGVLPAHAQTSGPVAPLYTFVSCIANWGVIGFLRYKVLVSALITPIASGVSLHLAILSNNGALVATDCSGDYPTDAGGAALSGPYEILAAPGDQIVFRWTFNNPADGSGNCDTTFP